MIVQRRTAGGLLAVWSLAALGCAAVSAGPPEGGPIQAWDLRDRLRQIEPGQGREDVHAILGRDPVQKPGHPDAPFSSPLRELTLTTPRGETVAIELYVVEAYPVEGCPDVVYRSEPVVFVDGAVAALGWDAVEARWREWGGTLAALRDAREVAGCPYPPA